MLLRIKRRETGKKRKIKKKHQLISWHQIQFILWNPNSNCINVDKILNWLKVKWSRFDQEDLSKPRLDEKVMIPRQVLIYELVSLNMPTILLVCEPSWLPYFLTSQNPPLILYLSLKTLFQSGLLPQMSRNLRQLNFQKTHLNIQKSSN